MSMKLKITELTNKLDTLTARLDMVSSAVAVKSIQAEIQRTQGLLDVCVKHNEKSNDEEET